jgi:molybdopterin molybdotransferase
MISIEKAMGLVKKYNRPLGPITLDFEKSLGFVLAEDIKTPAPLPRFDNSAMDGFAIRSVDTTGASTAKPRELEVVDTIYAGQFSRRRLRSGETCRIMTGAPVPPGADAVAQKEEVVDGQTGIKLDHPVTKGRHIRRRGGEIARGTVVLKKGSVIDAGAVACLASVGRRRVRVCRKPTVAVIATGDETVAPGAPLAPGQIYDSNSFMVAAALRQMGLEPRRVRHVKDHPTALRNAVAAALRSCDALIVTGGISVGDRDYLRLVLGRERVREHFWRVKQKPGKPIYFGTRGKNVVFGLPGNPASVFTCFYMYVYPALRHLGGFADGLPERHLPLAVPVVPDRDRWRLMKARTIETACPTVKPLARQASHMISSLANTNSLAMIPPGNKSLEAGTVVKTFLLPGGWEVKA